MNYNSNKAYLARVLVYQTSKAGRDELSADGGIRERAGRREKEQAAVSGGRESEVNSSSRARKKRQFDVLTIYSS